MIETKYVPPTTEELVDAIGWMLPEWGHQCHAVSLAIVKAGVLPAGSRVARGTAHRVPGQHSWIVVQTNGTGELADCYADDAVILDPTLWSYVEDVDDVWIGVASSIERHLPRGKGPHIMEVGRPPYPVAEPIPLAPDALAALSSTAQWWIREMFGPLDRAGWIDLSSHTSVTGWPAGEILAAMDDTEELTALVPIDLLGMLTDRNPDGLFLAER